MTNYSYYLFFSLLMDILLRVKLQLAEYLIEPLIFTYLDLIYKFY
jgi:hypothetical protein